VNTPRLNPSQRQVLDLPTPEGWKAELTCATGYIPRRFTRTQAVINLISSTGSQTRDLLITSPTPQPLHHQAISVLPLKIKVLVCDYK